MSPDSAPPDLTPEDLERRRALASQIETYVRPYLAKNPRARRAVHALISGPRDDVDVARFAAWDHLAFRAFDCVDGGLRAVARVFEKHGYTHAGSLTFPEKRVDAEWFAPPTHRWARDARGDPAFPRLFVSHLRVDDVARDAKAVILRTACVHAGTRATSRGARDATRVAERGGVPWCERDARVSRSLAPEEYETVARASEYAAWTLINGHALNHVAVAVHRLFVPDDDNANVAHRWTRRRFASLEQCLAFLAAPPLSTPMSRAGGAEIKASPDGGLRQAATVAELVEVEFAKGKRGDEDEDENARRARVPASYVEFVDRLPTSAFAATVRGDAFGDERSARSRYVPERLRRDGFETGNADAIFESTFRAQTDERGACETGRTDRGDARGRASLRDANP